MRFLVNSIGIGGIGVIGGLHQNPKVLQNSIDEIRANLEDKNAPIGVDLLLPQVGGNARKTIVRSVLISHGGSVIDLVRYSVRLH